MRKKLRVQRRIPGLHRRPISSTVLPRIESALQSEMRRYNVSRSFVIANALAYIFQIDLDREDDYKRSR